MPLEKFLRGKDQKALPTILVETFVSSFAAPACEQIRDRFLDLGIFPWRMVVPAPTPRYIK
jgi:hypothetical protein